MKNNLLTEQLAYNGDSRTKTHIHLIRYSAGTFEETLLDAFTPEAVAVGADEKIWLRIHGLKDAACIEAVCTHFGADFLTIQDILNADHPSKVEEHDGFNFMVGRIFQSDSAVQVRLMQGEHFVLSFVEGDSGFFDDVARALRDNVLRIRMRTADYLFLVLMNGVISNYVSLAMSIGDELDDLESELLAARNERDIGIQLQMQRRRYMELKRTVMPLREQFQRLLRSDSGLVRKASRPFFNDVSDHLQNAVQLVEGCRETLSSLMDLYISNNDLRMNDIMKRLTIVSTIFIPLTLPRRGVGHELRADARTALALRLCRGVGRDACGRRGGLLHLPRQAVALALRPFRSRPGSEGVADGQVEAESILET